MNLVILARFMSSLVEGKETGTGTVWFIHTLARPWGLIHSLLPRARVVAFDDILNIVRLHPEMPRRVRGYAPRASRACMDMCVRACFDPV